METYKGKTVNEMTERDWEEVAFFKPHEFTTPSKLSKELLVRLDHARQIAEVPFFITSDYRFADHKAHGLGLAVDVADDPYADGITSTWRMTVVKAALGAGFRRIGVYDKHIHLDIWEGVIQDVLWVGQSQ